VRSEALPAATASSWYVKPFSLLDSVGPEDGSNIFSRNVGIYHTTFHHIPPDINFHSHHLEKLISKTMTLISSKKPR
jgi:hypothetical protein